MHDTPLSIEAQQQALIEEFSMLAEDYELLLTHLIDQGKTLPALNEEDKKEVYLVKGCLSRVWLLASHDQEKRMHYRAQSDAAITRGLICLLLRIYSHQPAEEVLKSELFFPSAIRMERFIGTQRSGGLEAMLTRIKQEALATLSVGS